jgi:hypothetical protein
VKEQTAYIFGMYAYAYGFPLVMMGRDQAGDDRGPQVW